MPIFFYAVLSINLFALDCKQEILKHKDLASQHPAANIAIIFGTTKTTVQEDGNYQKKEHMCIVSLTPSGKNLITLRKLYYHTQYENIKIDAANVIKKDGTVIPVKKEDIKDITNSSSAAMNVFDPNSRQKIINYPNLEVGDGIEVEVTTLSIQPAIENFFSDLIFFQDTEPVHYVEYLLHLPKKFQLHYKEYNIEHDVPATLNKTSDDKHNVYKWTKKNPAQITFEPAMNFLNDSHKVLLSTDTSWKIISKWYYDLSNKLDLSKELKAEIKNLTKDKKTTEEKIKALYFFVAQKVRYMGLGFGIKAGLEPKPAKETYETRYGVCRDVAVLLAAMLREIELDARVSITNAGSRVESEIPVVFAFNHAFVTIVNKDGTFKHLDPTIKFNIDLLPATESEQQVLVTDKKGLGLSTTPTLLPESSLAHFKINTDINNNFSLKTSVHLKTKGFIDYLFRVIRSYKSQEDFKNFIQGFVNDKIKGILLKDFSMSNINDFSKNLTANLKLEKDSFAIPAKDYLLLKPLSIMGAFSLIIDELFLQSARLPKRKYTLNFESPTKFVETEEIKIPDGYTVAALPNNMLIQNQTSAFSVDCKNKDPKKVTCTKSVSIRKKHVKPEEYQELKEVLRKIGESENQYVIFKKKS